MMSDPDHLEREVRIHKRLRELLLLFSQRVSNTFSVAGALEPVVTAGLKDILGASSVEIWLHDRRARVLTLVGSAGGPPLGSRVDVADTAHYAAEGLRLERPAMRGARIVAPLRGWRRALGAISLVPDGSLDDQTSLEFTHEVARQISVAIENLQLLADVMRQRRLLEDTFNSLIDLVAVTDNDLRLVQTNEAFAARVGLTRAEMIGRPLKDLVGAETLAYAQSPDPHDSAAPPQHRVADDALKGTFVLTATPLSNQAGDIVGRVLVARDITRQTRLEAERAALRERLAQSEKLASLGQFVAGIAHEMNNPLQGVLGHLELLIDMTEAAKPVRKELKTIYNEADRAAKIVHNLLVFTGSHRMQREPVALDRIVTRALASRGAHLRRANVNITRRKGKGVPLINADPLLLQQALLNIIINAEHAMRDCENRQLDIDTTVNEAGDVSLTIRDSGPGIPADVLPRVFDPFFTTKEVGQGTGLGLAITYGIVVEHGGTITAGAAPGGGAVFRVELPGSVGGGKVTQGHPTHDR